MVMITYILSIFNTTELHTYNDKDDKFYVICKLKHNQMNKFLCFHC